MSKRWLPLAVVLLGAWTAAANAQDGDAAAGEKVLGRCMACHTHEVGSPGKIGPDLTGVFGRTAGTAEGFARYSDALVASGIVWDEAALTQWLAGPAKLVPGTKMTFRLNKPEDIANVIAYLRADVPAGTD